MPISAEVRIPTTKQEPTISVEQQEVLSRIKNLRKLVIDKLLSDKKTARPNPFAYQRQIKINGGILQFTYYKPDSNPDSLEISCDKKPLNFRQDNRTIRDSIKIDNKGGFKRHILHIQPDRVVQTLYYELNDRNSNQHPATPEVILEVENLMNLYLQADTSRSIVRRIADHIFQ